MEKCINGFYESVWDDGSKILLSDAKINLDTKEVEILESYEPKEHECQILNEEHVIFDDHAHPCIHISELEEAKIKYGDNVYWYK